MMDISDFKNTYWNYYLQIEKDFFETAPYCTIDEGNKNAFSTRYLQLHLSICSEIDTICKTFCKELDDGLDLKSCGINDYIRILCAKYPTFVTETVKLSNSKYGLVQPWKGIDSGHIPSWWSDYNKIKHHRDEEQDGKPNYKLATQRNVILALSALYVLIEYWAAKNFASDSTDKDNRVMRNFISNYMNLQSWDFYLSFMGQPLRFDCKAFHEYIEQGVQ